MMRFDDFVTNKLSFVQLHRNNRCYVNNSCEVDILEKFVRLGTFTKGFLIIADNGVIFVFHESNVLRQTSSTYRSARGGSYFYRLYIL